MVIYLLFSSYIDTISQILAPLTAQLACSVDWLVLVTIDYCLFGHSELTARNRISKFDISLALLPHPLQSFRSYRVCEATMQVTFICSNLRRNKYGNSHRQKLAWNCQHDARCWRKGKGATGLQNASECQGKVKYNAVTWQLHKQIAG